MAAPQVLQNFSSQDITSLLVPLAGRTLLLPTVSVAEMAIYKEPSSVPDTPDWFLGFFQWRGLAIPLLSFEVLNGETSPGTRPKSRVAVLNSTGISADLPFIALLTQGIPRLARVTAEEITRDDNGQCKAFETLHVSLAGEKAVIPDVAALEQVYLGLELN